MNFRCARLQVLLLVLSVLPLHSAFAHGTGAIKLSSKQSSPGATITVLGTEFAKNSSVRLELRGILATQAFGRVQTGANGTFQQVVTIPAATKPGQYSLVAVAPDGDVAAEATLMISAASAEAETQPGMANMPGMADMPGMHATAEMMKVPIPITARGWAVIVTIIVASAAMGVWLLRSAPRTQAV